MRNDSYYSISVTNFRLRRYFYMTAAVSSIIFVAKMRFSSNIASVQESGTFAFLAKLSRRQAKDPTVISLITGEFTSATPEYAAIAGMGAISDGFTHYTVNSGVPELREVISHKLKLENNFYVTPEQVLVSCGSKHALFNVLFSLCGESDEVIIFSPYYPSYPEIVKLARAMPVIVETNRESDYQIDLSKLKRAITPRTKLIIVNSPGNPTGVVYSKESLGAVAQVALDEKIWIISDEIYEKVIFPPHRHLSLTAAHPRLIDRFVVVNGFSKSHAMTGWRIGYAAGPEELIKKAALIQSHTTSNAPSMAQRAAIAAYNNGDEFIKSQLPKLEYKLSAALAELGKLDELKLHRPAGAFYLFPSIKQLMGRRYGKHQIYSSTAFCEFLLEEKNVGVVPGTAFGDDNAFRITCTAEERTLMRGVNAIKEGVKLLQE